MTHGAAHAMVPLTVRSHYSLMWGTASVERICRTARQMGYDALALTDTDNLYGLWRFLAACRREGIIPIVGAEITQPLSHRRAVCLVEDDAGYVNLCRMITRRHMRANFDLASSICELGRGLTVLTTDPELLAAGRDAGVHVAAAMPRKPVSAGHPLRQTAKRLDLPLVAVPGSFFLTPGEEKLHRVLRAICRRTTLSRLPADTTAPADAWLAPPAEYARRFAVCPETLLETRRLVERVAFRGPSFGIVLPLWKGRVNRDAHACLRSAAYLGARRRYGRELPEPVVDRLEQELGTIADMGFSGYFLTVRDIVRGSSRTCGRGSGAASLVAYCLGITNVCPIKCRLYFGRFLNPGRQDPPDIDVDFAWDERDDVLRGVFATYGDRAAMVCNHVCFQPKMALREVAKVYGLPDGEIGRVTRRLSESWPVRSETGFVEEVRKPSKSCTRGFPPPWDEILALARQLIAAPRHLSVHPGGVVMTPRPVDHYVPVQRTPKGFPVIQWEKDAAEDAGLVKIDLLGNRSLGVIRDAIGNLRENGIDFREPGWEPEDDFETREIVAQGRTMGCFYIESPAMRLLQEKSGVGDFEHLVIHSSIIRPAANPYIQEYIRRLHGGTWPPIHPLLKDVLAETFGIMVYQEDVSRAAAALAGFSDADADGLRRALSKKDRALRLRDYRNRFREGARRRGVSVADMDAVWDMMMSFDGYSFCKPHSASYARVSFQAAFLKVHHPAEFIASVISNRGGFYDTFAYVSEARRMGLNVLPPDVRRSRFRWTGIGRDVRVGLLSIRGLGEETARRIVQERAAGPYLSPADFFSRVRPDEDEARALVRSGALDGFHPEKNRSGLLWAVAKWQAERRRTGTPGQLFAPAPAYFPPLPPEDPVQRLRAEFEVLGFLCGGHPISLYADVRRKAGCVRALDLPKFAGRKIRLAGWLITGKSVQTKHGDTMAFLTFEDESNLVETTFFPETYRRFCRRMVRGRPYLLHGEVERDWGAVTLRVETVVPLRRIATPGCKRPATRVFSGANVFRPESDSMFPAEFGSAE